MPVSSPESTKSKPSVLVLTPWYGGNTGGVAIVVETLVHALRDAGHECVVLLVGSHGGWPRYRRGRGGEHIYSVCAYGTRAASNRKGRAGERARGFLIALLLRWITRRFQLRIAHFHYIAPGYDTVLPVVQQLKLHIINTFHGSDINVGFTELYSVPTLHRLIDASRAVVAVSAGLGTAVVRHAPRAAGKMHVIHNAVARMFLERASDARSVQDIDVLFIGNLIPVKGPFVLLEAFAVLAKHRPGTTLGIVGSGSLQETLIASAKSLGIADAVTFLGRVAREDLPAVYARARVLAMPSLSEGLPLVALEAQLLGVPVVATMVGGIPEAVEEGITGTMVPPNDPAALAEALRAVLDDEPLRARLGRNARARALLHFGPSQMAQSYSQLYQQILMTSKPTSA